MAGLRQQAKGEQISAGWGQRRSSSPLACRPIYSTPCPPSLSLPELTERSEKLAEEGDVDASMAAVAQVSLGGPAHSSPLLWAHAALPEGALKGAA